MTNRGSKRRGSGGEFETTERPRKLCISTVLLCVFIARRLDGPRSKHRITTEVRSRVYDCRLAVVRFHTLLDQPVTHVAHPFSSVCLGAPASGFRPDSAGGGDMQRRKPKATRMGKTVHM